MQILVEKMGIPDKKGLSKLDQQASLNPQYDQRVKLGCYQALSLSLALAPRPSYTQALDPLAT